MSELRVDNIVDMGGSGAPKLRKGANVTGISTITQAIVGNATINAGGINATGIVTSSSNKFVGDLASGNITAGVMTATSSVVASNITINSGGVNASGIVSATSYQGSGANLTGVGLSIAPLAYNPDPSAVDASRSTGIGLTFNQRVFAGTGNVTLSLVSVGSTLVENFGVGSSVTYNNDADPPNITITPTSSLSADTVYAISYPSGAFTQSGAGGSFVGTAYTFDTASLQPQLWIWGRNYNGEFGNNDAGGSAQRSSPIQISGATWNTENNPLGGGIFLGTKTDGTLWATGSGDRGQLAQNNEVSYSSPVQIPGTTWVRTANSSEGSSYAIKTDGTLWAWGYNAEQGQLGHNNRTNYSSPVQIPGTTWSVVDSGNSHVLAIKTNGTLWAWGYNGNGQLGQNSTATSLISSPVQIPGTTWSHVSGGNSCAVAIKTDGTLWAWGANSKGGLGVNNRTEYSSPIQIPGTWSDTGTVKQNAGGIKTDGTLWVWGENEQGELAQNIAGNPAARSSPVQVPGTTWSKFAVSNNSMAAVKTDGTLWGWGSNAYGSLGVNKSDPNRYSSPVQVPGTDWSDIYGALSSSTKFIGVKIV